MSAESVGCGRGDFSPFLLGGCVHTVTACMESGQGASVQIALYDQCMGERVIHEIHCVPQAVHTHVNHHIIHLTSAMLLSSLGGESLSAQAGQVLI